MYDISECCLCQRSWVTINSHFCNTVCTYICFCGIATARAHGLWWSAGQDANRQKKCPGESLGETSSEGGETCRLGKCLWQNYPSGAMYGQRPGGKCLGGNVEGTEMSWENFRISTQDYKSPCISVMICGTLVNRQPHSHTQIIGCFCR